MAVHHDTNASITNCSAARAMEGNQSSSCSIRLPPYTAYVAINGTMGPQQGNVSFILSPNISTTIEGLPSTVSTNSAYLYLSPLYETPLDPAQQYSLTIQVADDGPVGIESISVISALG